MTVMVLFSFRRREGDTGLQVFPVRGGIGASVWAAWFCTFLTGARPKVFRKEKAEGERGFCERGIKRVVL
ncbi:MAG: hypothetical protein EGS44_06915 [Akkermansia muciniphila]|nr:hypothetical protein [Akkermansia muciniphila]